MKLNGMCDVCSVIANQLFSLASRFPVQMSKKAILFNGGECGPIVLFRQGGRFEDRRTFFSYTLRKVVMNSTR